MTPFRASIISGEELAKSDVGERESRREKKAGDSSAKSGRNALWLPLPHSSSSTSQRSIKDRWGPPPLLGSSGDLELLAAGEQAYPLACSDESPMGPGGWTWTVAARGELASARATRETSTNVQLCTCTHGPYHFPPAHQPLLPPAFVPLEIEIYRALPSSMFSNHKIENLLLLLPITGVI